MKKRATQDQSAALELFTAKNYTPPQNKKCRYQPDFPAHAFKLCLLGATNKMLALYFNVSETTIHLWMKKVPAFGEAVASGKRAADMEVAHSLYLSTLDRVITLKQAIKCKEVYYDENGKRAERERVEVVEVEKHIPGDYRAQQFWLRNRNPQLWGLKDDGGEPVQIVTLNLGSGHNPVLNDEITG